MRPIFAGQTTGYRVLRRYSAQRILLLLDSTVSSRFYFYNVGLKWRFQTLLSATHKGCAARRTNNFFTDREDLGSAGYLGPLHILLLNKRLISVWCRIFLGQLIDILQVKQFPAFLRLERSPHYQISITGSYCMLFISVDIRPSVYTRTYRTSQAV